MLLYDSETYQINGAMFEVHKHLGPGLLEKVYQEALALEFQERGIPFEREKHFKINYKGSILEQEYIADFVCFNKIIVELKAVSQIEDIHRSQVYNYLHISGYQLALLQNFNQEFLQPAERIVI